MACGDKYAGMLRTATGKGPEDFSDTASWAFLQGEYDEVLVVARRIAGEVKKRWLRVQDLQRHASNLEKGGAELAEILDALPGDLEAYAEAKDALPESTYLRPFTSDVALVQAAWDNARDGTCLMERLDTAIELMGGTPPATTTPPQERQTGSWWEGLVAATVGGAVFLGLGYLVYWGIKKKGRKEALNAG